MNPIKKLSDYLAELPGIGPRQAKRIVYYLLTRDARFTGEMSALLSEIKSDVKTCTLCYQFFHKTATESELCPVCRDKSRDRSALMIVARDADLEIMEKSGAWSGLYLVLGGSVPLLEK